MRLCSYACGTFSIYLQSKTLSHSETYMKYARSQAKGVALQRPDPGISGQLSSVFKQSRLLCGTLNRKTSNILRGNGHRD